MTQHTTFEHDQAATREPLEQEHHTQAPALRPLDAFFGRVRRRVVNDLKGHESIAEAHRCWKHWTAFELRLMADDYDGICRMIESLDRRTQARCYLGCTIEILAIRGRIYADGLTEPVFDGDGAQ